MQWSVLIYGHAMKTGARTATDAGAVQTCYHCLNDIVLLCGFLKCVKVLKFQRL